MGYNPPGSMGFSKQEYWIGQPFPSPENLPNPGTGPGSPTRPADSLSSESPGQPLGTCLGVQLFFFFKVFNFLASQFSLLCERINNPLHTFRVTVVTKEHATCEDRPQG